MNTDQPSRTLIIEGSDNENDLRVQLQLLEETNFSIKFALNQGSDRINVIRNLLNKII